MDDDNIVHLKLKVDRPASEAPMLKVVGGMFDKECGHRSYFENGQFIDCTYLIRQGETEVECSRCGTRLDPMWVLQQLAGRESKWHQSRERYRDEMKRLSERSRTKCDHCGNMTRISRK